MSDGISCKQFQELLDALLDQELGEDEAGVLAGHVGDCPGCADLQAAELHLRSLIKERLHHRLVSTPPHLRARILVSIHRQTLVRLDPPRPH